jgi:hypothetical protein
MSEIPKKVVNSDIEEKELPQEVAELSQELESPESNPYLISFAKYNDKMCELSLINNNKAKKAIETLKIIGTKIRSKTDFQRYSIDRIPVRFEGEYKKLFKGLQDDVELKEIKLQQKARLFYFDIEPDRIMYVVAIRDNHLETDKVRR